MDTINVPATSTETVANANAETINETKSAKETITKINAFVRKVGMKVDGVEKKIDRCFIGINDFPGTALENISFGPATSAIRTAEKLYGIDAVDVCICECLGCTASCITEYDDDDKKYYVTGLVVDGVDAKAVKDALMFFKELNS